MTVFKNLQFFLEETYGVKTGLDVSEFIRPLPKLDSLGQLLIDQSNDEEPSVALLLDRDIFEAWCSFSQSSEVSEKDSRRFSVVCEELSHFVYFGYNHQRGRNITALEMEIQSEIDRILLAFHAKLNVTESVKIKLVHELNEISYPTEMGPRYEESRITAKNFLNQLGLKNPQAWAAKEFSILRNFFHNDLPGKLALSKKI
jgi:hypothetical protein